jgi:hypothetical protein
MPNRSTIELETLLLLESLAGREPLRLLIGLNRNPRLRLAAPALRAPAMPGPKVSPPPLLSPPPAVVSYAGKKNWLLVAVSEGGYPAPASGADSSGCPEELLLSTVDDEYMVRNGDTTNP